MLFSSSIWHPYSTPTKIHLPWDSSSTQTSSTLRRLRGWSFCTAPPRIQSVFVGAQHQHIGMRTSDKVYSLRLCACEQNAMVEEASQMTAEAKWTRSSMEAFGFIHHQELYFVARLPCHSVLGRQARWHFAFFKAYAALRRVESLASCPTLIHSRAPLIFLCNRSKNKARRSSSPMGLAMFPERCSAPHWSFQESLGGRGIFASEYFEKALVLPLLSTSWSGRKSGAFPIGQWESLDFWSSKCTFQATRALESVSFLILPPHITSIPSFLFLPPTSSAAAQVIRYASYSFSIDFIASSYDILHI